MNELYHVILSCTISVSSHISSGDINFFSLKLYTPKQFLKNNTGKSPKSVSQLSEPPLQLWTEPELLSCYSKWKPMLQLAPEITANLRIEGIHIAWWFKQVKWLRITSFHSRIPKWKLLPTQISFCLLIFFLTDLGSLFELSIPSFRKYPQ